MSSFLRTLQRRALRKSPDYEAKPQPTVVKRHGYKTLRPTRGWAWFSNARLVAQRRMADLLNHVLPERRKRPAKVWRKPRPVPPSTETRQQRRAAERRAK